LDTAIARQSGLLNRGVKENCQAGGISGLHCVGYCKAHNAKIITGDKHFRDLTNDVMVK
jgi:hypothetical protein